MSKQSFDLLTPDFFLPFVEDARHGGFHAQLCQPGIPLSSRIR